MKSLVLSLTSPNIDSTILFALAEVEFLTNQEWFNQ